MDKDLEQLSALCAKKPSQRLTESIDPDLIRLAQTLGRSITNYIPKTRTFSKPDMTIDYQFMDSDIANISNTETDVSKPYIPNTSSNIDQCATHDGDYKPDMEIYSSLTVDLLKDIKNCISYACGTSYPDLDDPLVHEIINEKVKRKVDKTDAYNILSRIYPFYTTNVTPFPGYSTLPILWGGGGIRNYDSDGDGIVDSKDPNPYSADDFTTNSSDDSDAGVGADFAISESVDKPTYTVSSTGIVTISYDGTTVTLSQADSSAFKAEILSCQSEEQKVTVMQSYVEKNSITEELIIDDGEDNIASLIEEAKI